MTNDFIKMVEKMQNSGMEMGEIARRFQEAMAQIEAENQRKRYEAQLQAERREQMARRLKDIATNALDNVLTVTDVADMMKYYMLQQTTDSAQVELINYLIDEESVDFMLQEMQNGVAELIKTGYPAAAAVNAEKMPCEKKAVASCDQAKPHDADENALRKFLISII